MMISWKKIAEADLNDYALQRESLPALKRKIACITASMTAIKGRKSDSAPVSGGTSKYEDSLISAIVLKEKLLKNYKVSAKAVAEIEKGLSGIPEEQRRVLELWYIENGGYEKVMRKLNIEKSGAYRRKDEALRAFTIAMYGITEF